MSRQKNRKNAEHRSMSSSSLVCRYVVIIFYLITNAIVQIISNKLYSLDVNLSEEKQIFLKIR